MCENSCLPGPSKNCPAWKPIVGVDFGGLTTFRRDGWSPRALGEVNAYVAKIEYCGWSTKHGSDGHRDSLGPFLRVLLMVLQDPHEVFQVLDIVLVRGPIR